MGTILTVIGLLFGVGGATLGIHAATPHDDAVPRTELDVHMGYIREQLSDIKQAVQDRER